MKKYIITALILIVIPAYIFDIYLHNWSVSQLKHTLHNLVPAARNIDASVGGDIINISGHHLLPKPMLPALVISHKLPNVSIHIQGGLHIGNLPIDDWVATASSISFDNKLLFDSKRVVVKEISNGFIQMTVSEQSLSAVRPDAHVVIDGAGNASVMINGKSQPLTAEVTADAIAFKAGDTEIASISTGSQRLLPCKPDAQFAPHELLLSCNTTKVPGVLSGTPD